MGLLDDTFIFTTLIAQGGFSHAARHLNLSNGMISRRVKELEKQIGVTLIKRTTRQIHLTPEGEIFLQHAKRIQQELDMAKNMIASLTHKPKGYIRVSAPLYFGQHFLTPILIKFMMQFIDIRIDLVLSNQRFDPIKDNLDLILRTSGYLNDSFLKDSSMRNKLLLKPKIGLFASPAYLARMGEPLTAEALSTHIIIGHMDKIHQTDEIIWSYSHKNKHDTVILQPRFHCNDMESSIIACTAGYGIGKFPELHIQSLLKSQQLVPVLQQYHWGNWHLYAVYPDQHELPKRTRLLLDFISTETKHVSETLSS